MGEVARNSLKGYTYQQSVFILVLGIMDTERTIGKIVVEALDTKNFDDIYLKDVIIDACNKSSYRIQAQNYHNVCDDDIKIDENVLSINGNKNSFDVEDNNILIVNSTLIETDDKFMGFACTKKEDINPIRFRRASVPYDVWYQQGYPFATEGNVVNYDFIEKFIENLGKKYHIMEIAVDRWNATMLTQHLMDDGFTMVPFGQGYKDMSPATKEFSKLLFEGKIVYGGNPVLRWMSGNVVVETDAAENIKVTKPRSPEKIDGIVAAIMALDRAVRNQGSLGSV